MSIGIIGAGALGSSIARLLARNGIAATIANRRGPLNRHAGPEQHRGPGPSHEHPAAGGIVLDRDRRSFSFARYAAVVAAGFADRRVTGWGPSLGTPIARRASARRRRLRFGGRRASP